MRSDRSVPALLLIAVVISAALAVPAAAGTPTVSTSGGTAAPGETVTVTIDVENAQTAKVGSIPSEWSIESVEAASATTIERDTYIGWAWTDDQTSQPVSIELGVPTDIDPREYTLDVTVEDSDGNTATTTAVATVEAPSTQTVTPDRVTETTTAGSGNGDGFTLVAAIVGVIASMLVVSRRRL